MFKRENSHGIEAKNISAIGTFRGAKDDRQPIPIRSLLGSAIPIRAIFRSVCLFLFFGMFAFHAGCKGCEDKGKTTNVGGGGTHGGEQDKENKKADQDANNLGKRAR